MLKKDNYTKFTEMALNTTNVRPALIIKLTEDTAKNGSTYVLMSLGDGYSQIDARMFDTSLTDLSVVGVEEGVVADLKISVKEYNGNRSYNVSDAKAANDKSLTYEDFVKKVPYDTGLLFDRIIDTVKKAGEDRNGKRRKSDDGREYDSLTGLTLKILNDNRSEFVRCAAAKAMHHNLVGGLVYHTTRMVCAAYKLCDTYSGLNRELLVCGTALHDIAKLKEMTTSLTGAADYTVDGNLMGHLYMGAELIHDEAKKGNYDPEEIRLLKHMILSHHGKQEWGAVEPPAIPEALVLHHIDMIDAGIYRYEEETGELAPGEATAKKPFGMDNVVYRPLV